MISDLIGEPFTGSFYEKELQKTNKKNSELKKYLKEKVINCMIYLIVGLIKRTSHKNESVPS